MLTVTLGYAGYAELIASADNFWIFRRFDRLNARVMLSMQDEIVDLEQNLDAVDKTAAAEVGDDVNKRHLSKRHECPTTLARPGSSREVGELLFVPTLAQFP
jgi:hypothetical protein